jgi:hypothetical protein
MAILKATGVDLPDHSLVFSMRTVVVSIAVGTVISLWQASGRPCARRAWSRSPQFARARSCRRRGSPAMRS